MKNQRRKPRVHECVGGPLCGAKFPNHDKFVYVDDDGCPHFYRKIKVMKDDHSAIATFHHYFGTDKRWATDAHPYLLPGERVYRPVV